MKEKNERLVMELQFYRRLNPQNPKTLFTQIAPSAKTQRSSDTLPQFFNSSSNCCVCGPIQTIEPTVENTLILQRQSAWGSLIGDYDHTPGKGSPPPIHSVLSGGV
jgi:hypothetical protein